MENNTYLFSSLPYNRESALLMTAGVEVDPNMCAGLLLGSLFLGLISYIWAFWSQRSRLTAFKEAFILTFSAQHGRLRGVQNIHNFLLSLLFIDIMNAITAVVLVIGFLGSTCNSGMVFVYAFFGWFISRCMGVVLHLLNALVCLLFLLNPQLGAKLRCFHTLVVLLMIVLIPFYVFYRQVAIFGLGTITIGLAVTIVAKCTVPAVSPSAAARKKPIVLVAMLTFLFVYTPPFILQCLIISAINREEPTDEYLTIFMKSLFFTSFHLLMDGLLCFLILKLPSEEEEQLLEEQQQQHQSFENTGVSPI
uniref:uncharacterized protein LOC117246493 n=1 Tax=Epinephelus lanceolatus TaxID=310571 RepID=UPI001445D1ED|nr:uncharacterized protein LOC117246493 [Epinephelus lanceolatus]